MITVIPTNRCSDIDIYINVNNRLKRCKWGRERHLTHLYAPEKGFRDAEQQALSIYDISERQRRALVRTEWGIVWQHPQAGLRPTVFAGGNIGERLMAIGNRHYGDIRRKAAQWMENVELPENRLDDLPTTFSGGEQQRINIACGFIGDNPILLLDEPTASLDAKNRLAVTQLINNAKDKGCAIVGIFHDADSFQCSGDRKWSLITSIWCSHGKLFMAHWKCATA
ncbi:ATP-binding cassette domain-containing protein [Pectobacterium carotovorum]|uniref:ATP-binding cassette domain-containing protein n=1 Tax=Pectobacterium carotovorum TaxID=554 RepID=UPI002081020F|nr:ATP-binding cassette domain-containing protein [Pectobacterium carotovorum]MDY4375280.1 ATP-binding cassette domain-containing protein [Pectobacterium carotovorum subsp. carotovorum]GKW38471.1 hypothetical protein PEC301875_24950 [Pectobacterium carotovorum subsp. carotovorum]